MGHVVREGLRSQVQKPSPGLESAWLSSHLPPQIHLTPTHTPSPIQIKPLGRVGRVGREPGPSSNPCTVPPLLACGPVAMAITVLGLSSCICGMEMITLSLGGPNTSEMGRVWSGVGGCGAGGSSLNGCRMSKSSPLNLATVHYQ